GVLYGGMHPKRRENFSPSIELTRGEFLELYITQNKSVSEMAKILNTTENRVLKKAREFGCKKPPKLKSILSKGTNLSKYGVDHPMKSEEVKAKVFANMDLEQRAKKAKDAVVTKYGVDNVFKLPEFQTKSRETRLQKYGSEHALQVEEFKDKLKKTTLERYGTEYAGLHTP